MSTYLIEINHGYLLACQRGSLCVLKQIIIYSKVSSTEKSVGSTKGMKRSVETSELLKVQFAILKIW